MSSLYHYTKFETLEKILDSKFLLGTDYNSTNDRLEYYWALQQLENAFDLYERKYNYTLSKEVQDRMGDIFKYAKGCTAFTVSFSKSPEIKDMWEVYGDHSKGVALEFKSHLSGRPHWKNYGWGVRWSELLMEMPCNAVEGFNENFIANESKQILTRPFYEYGEWKLHDVDYNYSFADYGLPPPYKNWLIFIQQYIYNNALVAGLDNQLRDLIPLLSITHKNEAFEMEEELRVFNILKPEEDLKKNQYFLDHPTEGIKLKLPFKFLRERLGYELSSVILGEEFTSNKQDVQNMLYTKGFRNVKVS